MDDRCEVKMVLKALHYCTFEARTSNKPTSVDYTAKVEIENSECSEQKY